MRRLLTVDCSRAGAGPGKGRAASERITLGVIGIGLRCTYDLNGMLGLRDVQCVAISDVQSSRRGGQETR